MQSTPTSSSTLDEDRTTDSDMPAHAEGCQLDSEFLREGTFGLMTTGGFTSFSRSSSGPVEGDAAGSVLGVDVGELQRRSGFQPDFPLRNRWIDDFAADRNAALAHADADERLAANPVAARSYGPSVPSPASKPAWTIHAGIKHQPAHRQARRFRIRCRVIPGPGRAPQLQGKQTVFRTGVAHDFQELFGADQNRLGLAVNCQDEAGAGLFQGTEHLGKSPVQLTTTNEANARMMRHRFLWAKIGREREGEEANRQAPPRRTMGLDKSS